MTDLAMIACGGRGWAKKGMVRAVLNGLKMDYPDMVLIEGGAKGADKMCGDWAKENDAVHLKVPAKWKEHDPKWCPGEFCKAKDYCLGAGPRRNQEMVEILREYGQQGIKMLTVAFKYDLQPDLKKGGTEDMLARSNAYHIPVYAVIVPTARIDD